MSLEQKTTDALGVLCFSNMKQAQALEDLQERMQALYSTLAKILDDKEYIVMLLDRDKPFAEWYRATRKAG